MRSIKEIGRGSGVWAPRTGMQQLQGEEANEEAMPEAVREGKDCKD